MSEDDAVSLWIAQLRAGDRTAASKLWERYFRRLAGLARKKLGDVPRLPADGEDVALSALKSFCLGVEGGRFPELSNRDNLWRLLVTLTVRKAQRLVRDEACPKRGGGQVLGEAALAGTGPSAEAVEGLEQVLGREPTPELAAEMAEEYQRLLDRLGDDELRSIALWKMEGHTSEEVAARLGKSLAAVERKLKLIRALWTEERVT